MRRCAVNWIEMTRAELERAVVACKGVCVVPMGCLETHGDHLPVGTDCFQVDAMVERAAEIEPVVKFPIYYQTQIAEAKQMHGTIALGSRLIWDLLEGTLDEIARNGFTKIVIVNGHGGNYDLLAYFAMRRTEAPRDYVLYLYQRGHWPCEGLPEMEELRESPGSHGGEMETSLMLAIRPDLVKRDKIKKKTRARLSRLAVREDFDTGFDWFAANPDHYQGGGHFGTKEKGEILLEAAAKRLAKAFKAAKKDTSAKKIMDEFFSLDVGNRPAPRTAKKKGSGSRSRPRAQ